MRLSGVGLTMTIRMILKINDNQNPCRGFLNLSARKKADVGKKTVKAWKAWAVILGEKLKIVRATKESAYSHWADLRNASDNDYEVIPCTITYEVKPKRKSGKKS